MVVFSPQIIENFRRGSADGLSLLFLIVWLAGDVFNIIGAVLQGVLPTMIILAVYYTLADIVLLGQCFYYRGFTLRDDLSASSSTQRLDESSANGRGHQGDHIQAQHRGAGSADAVTERTALLDHKSKDHAHHRDEHDERLVSPLSSPRNRESLSPHLTAQPDMHRRHSTASFRDILHPSIDSSHLSPAVPFVEAPTDKDVQRARTISTFQTVLFNVSAIGLVCAAGIMGWYVSPSDSKKSHHDGHDSPGSDKHAAMHMDPLGQVFGYLCAVLYLGSRIPQLLLNFRRKSTEGVSLLFFLFACIGNLTYVLSILAYSPTCVKGQKHHCRPGEAAAEYGMYVLVNLSWLIGSLGTLLLDMAIFVQFFLYRENGNGEMNGREEDRQS